MEEFEIIDQLRQDQKVEVYKNNQLIHTEKVTSKTITELIHVEETYDINAEYKIIYSFKTPLGKTITYQYGEEISTNVVDYVDANPSVLESVKLDLSHVSTEVGKYQGTIEYFGEKQTFEILVVDTVKPKVQLKKVQWNIQLGQTIKAESLIKNIEDRSQTEVYFYDEKSKQKSKSKSYNVEGSYIEKIVVEDEHGNQSSALRVKVVEANKVLPEINGVKDITIKVGEKIDLLKGITAIDDLEGDITSRIIVEGTVNSEEPGDYQIVYTVKDNAGNVGKKVRKVTVVKDDSD